MTDINKAHIGWIVIGGNSIIMPCDEIIEAKIKSFHCNDPDSKMSKLDGNYIVQLVKASPTIEFVCADENDAIKLVEFLNKSKKVLSIKDYRKGK